MKRLVDFLEQEERALPVDSQLQKRVYKQLARNRPRVIWPLLMPAFGFAVLALAIVALPLAYQPEESFLQQVQAAYEQSASQAVDQNLIHHLKVLRVGHSPTGNQEYEIESWSNSDSTTQLKVFDSSGTPSYVLRVDGEDFVKPIDNRMARESEAENLRLGATTPHYFWTLPEGVVSGGEQYDPLDADTVCFTFTRLDAPALAARQADDELRQLTQSDDSAFDPRYMENLASFLATDTQVKDLGTRSLDNLGAVHGYEVALQDPEGSSQTEYWFDTTTYRLKQYTFTLFPNADPAKNHPMTRTAIMLVDEMLTTDQLPDDLFDAQQYGLEPRYVTVYEKDEVEPLMAEEACYSAPIDSYTPRKLSAEDEAEVRARIEAAKNK